ncbi:MAG: twin-arginine translocase TatA/TatE family subunit [bacterium]|nr:twin-arginine translocase TatA/TatE family subunit [bacterium]
MFGIGIPEALLIIALGALIFGGKKLPQLGKGLGEGIMNFKNSLKKGNEDDENNETNDSATDKKG